MKKILIILLAATTLVGCSHVGDGFKFRVSNKKASWMNGVIGFQTDMNSNGRKEDNVAFRAYLKNKDGRTIEMPGIDFLGCGASSPMGMSGVYKANDGYSQAELLSQTKNKMVIHLNHDPWNIYDEPVTLDKQITLFRDSPIMEVIDYYTGSFELLNVAAGINAGKATVFSMDNAQIIKYPDGLTAILFMPDSDDKPVLYGSAFMTKEVKSDEPLRYYIGLSDKGADYLLEELDKIL